MGSLLDEALEAFAERVRAGARSPATLEMRRYHGRRILTHLNRNTALARIDETALDRLSRRLRAGRMEATVSKILSTLRAALRLARRRRWITRMPEFPELAGRSPAGVDYLTREQWDRVFDALPRHRGEWLAVALYTGQHPSDVNRMRRLDCDPWADPPWFVRRNTKNRKQPIRVVMPAALADLLRTRIVRDFVRPGDHLVVPWNDKTRSKVLLRLGRRLGFRITATALRHTAATWIVDRQRAVTRAAQEYLGHSTSSMIERVYAHALPPRFGEVAAALDAMAADTRLPPRRVPSPVAVAGGEKETASSLPGEDAVSEPVREAFLERGPSRRTG